eukprot:CAMPEP_0182479028 /NCGR_PEP_ID=MMETSP1319-20130603/33469_1 /TAXON_ID=172717 /ORGANISM="Bolidomonas pacifica, Strain RCC208" /LENGTH=110 /DNA_ID=CAMNT_0024680419 /DNA_START=220 /DNA_END=548 /DNA_ORIENTATION=-
MDADGQSHAKTLAEEDDEREGKSSIGVDKYFRHRSSDKHVLKIYKQLLIKAYLPKKHNKLMDDLYGSEKMPMGAVSLKTYNSIFNARSFDAYGKIVAKKLTEKEKMIADL